MPTIKKRLIITGLIGLIGFTFQVNSALAIYSPRLSQQAAVIRQHIRDSQAQNGKNTILEEVDQIIAYDKARREAFTETGISGDVRVAQDLIFNSTLNFLIQHPFDSLMMAFNINAVNKEIVSSCLRDDIWTLESLRDKVGAEMLKAYMLRDTLHGALLMEDYGYLTTNLDLLRKYGSNPSAKIQATDKSNKAVTITSTKYFFGTDGTDPNYYKNIPDWISDETGCPESEFQEAFREVVNSSKTLATLGSGGALDWSFRSIWSMAQANARIRAQQWIKANQLSLTVGGTVGGKTESLVKGGGLEKFVGDFKTQLQVAKNMVGPITPFYNIATNYKPPADANVAVGNNCRFFRQSDGFFQVCNTEQKAQWDACRKDEITAKDKGIRCDRFRNAAESISIADKLNAQKKLEQENADALGDVENAFTYSITMDSVAEQNIYFMDEVLWDMNNNIKRGYELVGEKGGKSIPTLTTEIAALSARQCPNRQ